MLIYDLQAAVKLLIKTKKERDKASLKDAENYGTRARKTTTYARHELACEQYNRMEKYVIELCEKIANGDCIRFD
jgi:hypothetical protein